MAKSSVLEFKSWRELFRIHPAADKMPSPTSEEFRALKEDIGRNGLQIPVEFLVEGGRTNDIDNWALLDGRSRLDAMHDLGYRFAFDTRRTTQSGVAVGPGKVISRHPEDGMEDDLLYRFHLPSMIAPPLEFVASLNVIRRHLNNAQKRSLTAELLKETPEHSNREVARLVGADHKTVGTVREDLEERGEIAKQDATIGHDGKLRTTARAKPAEPAPEAPARPRMTEEEYDRERARISAAYGEPKPSGRRDKANADEAAVVTADAPVELRNTVNCAAEKLGPRAELVLDLSSPEGMRHSWRMLINNYGFDPIIDLFKRGLETSEPQLFEDHIDELRDLVEAISDDVVDVAWQTVAERIEKPSATPAEVAAMLKVDATLVERHWNDRPEEEIVRMQRALTAMQASQRQEKRIVQFPPEWFAERGITNEIIAALAVYVVEPCKGRYKGSFQLAEWARKK